MASFLVLLAIAELVSLVVLHQVGTARLEDEADRDLVVATDELRAWLREGPAADLGQPGGPTLDAAFDDYLRARPARRDQAFLAIVDGRPVLASAGAPVALAELPAVERWASLATSESGEVDTPAGAMRWLAVPVTAQGAVVGVLVATEFLADDQQALRDTVVTVAVVTVLVLAGACLLAWGAAGRALAPLHHLATTARSVGDGSDLSARIEVTGTDEVAGLATSFNGMLDRLQGAFDSQKRFLDDAGHQLRTPITIVRGHVELLDDDPERRADDVALVLDELDRMDRLVGELRVLARSERPDFLDPDDVDADQLVAEVGRKAQALADRSWAVRPDAGGARLRADRQRLSEALLNLVDNAVHVTGTGDAVEVGACRRDGAVELYVRDTGPGIDPSDVATLFDRNGRNVRHRPGGTGLGLPIVAAIARAHGGSVAVESAPGAGARIALVVPTERGGP